MKYLRLLFMVMISAVAILGLAACGNDTANSASPGAANPGTANPGNKSLVVYFSRAGENSGVGTVEKGNTAKLAEEIAKQTGADIYEIQPVDPYPTDYEETRERVHREADEHARPAIKTDTMPDFSKYDTIFVGYPVWHYDMPMLMYTFFENYDFSGKTIVPFDTNAGSGMSNTDEHIKQLEPNATVLEGLAVEGRTAQNDSAETANLVKEWLTKLNLSK